MIAVDTITLGALTAIALAGIAFSTVGYMLTVSQTLMYAIELVHSLMAGALMGALLESITGIIPMQLVIFVYSMAISVLVAELVRHKISRDTVVALVASVSAVVTLGSLWGLAYIAPLGISRALGALWGSALLVTPADLTYLITTTLTVIMVVSLFDLELKYISFDPDLAYVSGLNVRAYYYLIYATTSLALSAAIKVYGTVITSALIVLPSVVSQYLVRRVSLNIFLLLGLSMSVSGYLVSLLVNAQTSLCIGIISLAATLLGTALRWFHGK